MDIALVRVDNRLIHGQILEAWVPYVSASCIVVVDDEVAGDFFRETVIRMAVPREVEVIISGVEEFARNYTYSVGHGKKAIVIFSSIADAFKAFHLGFKFARLNLGNVHHLQHEEDKVSCSSCVFLNDSDIQNIISLADSGGAQIEVRRIPMEAPVDVRDIVKMPSRTT
ncbi:MAG TPA: PTS sugar transporter subunit IIB [Syntrophales bacterium]|nr:PTS sugar transporter subunit IIB [Syntrophales bacterium]